jgi:hypothetical protein
VPLLLAAAALGVWLARDLPRREVERRLAEGFGARVSLARLEVAGVDRFVLHGVEVREMAAFPQLVRLRAERVYVHATLGEVLDGSYREVRLSGVDAQLAHSTRKAGRTAGTTTIFVERLPVDEATVTIEEGADAAVYSVTGELHGIGSDLGGELRVRSDGFGVSPLITLLFGRADLARATRVESLEGRLLIDRSGRSLRVEAESRAVTIDAGLAAPQLADEVVSLPGLSITGSAEFGDDGDVQVEVHPAIPGIESTAVSLRLDADGSVVEGGARVIGADLRTLAAMLYPLPAGAEVRGRVDLDVAIPGTDRVEVEATGRLERLRPPGLETLALEGLSLAADGILSLGAGALRSCRYTVTASAERGALTAAELDLAVDGLRLRWDGDTDLSGDTSFDTELELSSPRGTVAGARLPPGVPPLHLRAGGTVDASSVSGEAALSASGLGRLQLAGAVPLGGGGSSGELAWTWRGASLATLTALARDAGLTVPEALTAGGAVRGAGRARGLPDRPAVDGRLQGEGLELHGDGMAPEEAWRVSGGALDVGFRLDGSDGPLAFDSVRLQGAVELPPLPSVPVSVTARGAVEPARGVARLDRLSVEAEGLGRVTGAADWDGTARLALDAEGVALDRWQTFLRPWLGDPLPGFGFRGSLASTLHADWREGRGWEGRADIGMTGSSMTHEDGSKVVEGAESTWRLEFAAPDASTLRLEAAGAVDGFVLLWGRVFGDYAERGADVAFSLDTAPPDPELDWRLAADVALKDGTLLHGSLAAKPAQPLVYSTRVEIPDLARTFRDWVHDPLAGSLPELAPMESGGSLKAELAGSVGPAERVVEGSIRVEGGRLEGTGGRIFVRGLRLELPVDLDWRIQEDGALRLAAGEPRSGWLQFEKLALGDVELTGEPTALVVQSDTIGLEEGLAVPLLDGVLGFEELTLVDALEGNWRLETGVLLSGIRLDVLSEALGILPLEGLAEGYFPRVRLTRDRLAVDGDGELEVFGGSLTVRDIAGKDVLSRFPKLRFSAELREIDLLEVTHTFDFGEMTGLIEGSITDCELFRWVPVRCAARFATVPRKDVPRTINVKAVSNIAILGTGGGEVSALDRGIHKFLDRYTYQRLGVSMELDNDRFVLRGLEQRGGRELFLKGRFPFRIDVVNVQPGRAIAFRSMLERVKRMDFADFDIR